MKIDDLYQYSESSKTSLIWKISKYSPTGGLLKSVGDVAGCLRYYKDGRPKNSCVNFQGKSLYCHRVIYEMFNGPIPAGMIIDHLDGNPHNNRIENLRLVTFIENSRNMRKFSTNTTGHVGVSYTASTNSWRGYHCDGEGVQLSKSFSVGKFGFEQAKQLALNFRNKAINEAFIKYTERHGK